MKKLLAALVLAILTISALGYSFACSNGGIGTDCICSVEFTKVTCKDNEVGKDIGSVRAQISSDRKTIQVCITNAYPGYEAQVEFTLRNRGDLPIHVDEVCIREYDRTALEVDVVKLIVCLWIMPGESKTGLETVRILDGAKPGWKYTFNVEIKTSCQPLEHPRSIGFWKHQFSVALCQIHDSPQVSTSVLAQYLNQINKQSQVFVFTGTQKQKFSQALTTLQPPDHSSMEAKLKAQLLGLWLNYVAGWTNGYVLQGLTAQQITQGSENAIIHHQVSQYEHWKDLCDRFNNIGET